MYIYIHIYIYIHNRLSRGSSRIRKSFRIVDFSLCCVVGLLFCISEKYFGTPHVFNPYPIHHPLKDKNKDKVKDEDKDTRQASRVTRHASRVTRHASRVTREDKLSEHGIRVWRAFFAAGLQGKGSYRSRCVSQMPVCRTTSRHIASFHCDCAIDVIANIDVNAVLTCCSVMFCRCTAMLFEVMARNVARQRNAYRGTIECDAI